jgi:hypothetical protein
VRRRSAKANCREGQTAFVSGGQQILACVARWIGMVSTNVLAADLLLATGGTAPRAPLDIPRAES